MVVDGEGEVSEEVVDVAQVAASPTLRSFVTNLLHQDYVLWRQKNLIKDVVRLGWSKITKSFLLQFAHLSVNAKNCCRSSPESESGNAAALLYLVMGSTECSINVQHRCFSEY